MLFEINHYEQVKYQWHVSEILLKSKPSSKTYIETKAMVQQRVDISEIKAEEWMINVTILV